MRRIAVIEDGYVRDTQIFTANPDIIEKEPDWEDNYRGVKYSCLYVGIFEGESEDEIRDKAASNMGVHPGIISLVEFEQAKGENRNESDLFEYERLRAHIGHDIEAVTYGDGVNVSIECLDCNEVLFSADNPANAAQKRDEIFTGAANAGQAAAETP